MWDGQWLLSLEQQEGVAVLPNVIPVKNIGYASDATHTRGPARSGFMRTLEMDFQLGHPLQISIDQETDAFMYYANVRNVPSLRLIWLYRALDFLALIPVRPRKAMRKLAHAL